MNARDNIVSKNHNLKLIYFSPTNSTKYILHKIAEKIDLPVDEEFNLTKYEFEDFKHSFDEDDFILLGFPVYGGRVPKTAMKRFNGFKANKSKIAIIQTYGDIHYDESLIEIHELVKNNGFIVIGLGSFICPHSLNFVQSQLISSYLKLKVLSVKDIATHRSNKEDYDLIKYFGKRLVQKLNGKGKLAIEMDDTKPIRKNRPNYPIKPKGNHNCSNCGLCVKLCPVNAIDMNNPRQTHKKYCICCMRCIKYCPNHARNFTKIEYFLARIFIEIVSRIFFKRENKSEIIV